MLMTSSYGVEIRKLNKPLQRTVQAAREAVEWLLPVIGSEWEQLKQIGGEKRRFNAAEKLIHETRDNRAKYPFDKHFPKMPSHLRRAVLQHVIGQVSGADTRGTKAGKEQHYMPVFYRDNMYRSGEEGTFLKLYNGSDWVWQEVRLKKTDLDYLKKYWTGKKEKAPVVVKRHKKYFLQFAFEE